MTERPTTGFLPRIAWCVVPMAAGAGMIAYAPALRSNIIVMFVGWATIAVCMLLAFRRWNAWVAHEDHAVRFVIGVGIAMRIAMIPMMPSLSDDLWRYAWDGRVVAAGHNPYAYAPLDAHLIPLRNEGFANIAYPEYHTIYPPLTELGFGACASISNALLGGSAVGTMIVWKVLLVIVESFTLVLLARLLRLLQLPVRGLLLYAWHPLPIVEFAGQGHSEALMVLGIALMLVGIARAKAVPAVAGYAGAIAARGVPLIFAPVLWRTMGWKRVALALVLGALVVIPFASTEAIAGVSASVRTMGQVFVFNACGFWVLYTICEWFHWWPLEPFLTSVLAVCFASTVVFIAIRMRTRSILDTVSALLAVSTAAVLLLWNMHPWYFAWGLMFIPLVPRRSWLWLTIISGFTYVHYLANATPWFVAVGVAEYTGFVILLGIEARAHRRTAR